MPTRRIAFRRRTELPELITNQSLSKKSTNEAHRDTSHCTDVCRKRPLDCHRTLLVGRELAATGVTVSHIPPGGSLETHAETMARLSRIAGRAENGQFRSEDEKIDAACAWQEERVVYDDESG